MELKILRKDEATGVVTVLSDEWEESGTVHTVGTLFLAPRGEAHGPHMGRTP